MEIKGKLELKNSGYQCEYYYAIEDKSIEAILDKFVDKNVKITIEEVLK